VWDGLVGSGIYHTRSRGRPCATHSLALEFAGYSRGTHCDLLELEAIVGAAATTRVRHAGRACR
jgi:hypothetical protein